MIKFVRWTMTVVNSLLLLLLIIDGGVSIYHMILYFILAGNTAAIWLTAKHIDLEEDKA